LPHISAAHNPAYGKNERTSIFSVFHFASSMWQPPGMQAKTEELLYLLLWTCDMLTRPTFRNLTDSFEAWAYRKGFRRQLAELERQRLLESLTVGRDHSRRLERVLRLSGTGRLQALGGRDPETWWRRRWDGHWRLVLFDVPNTQAKLRNRLRTQLRRWGFGWLQNSVWISPDAVDLEKLALAGSRRDVESLIILEARPAGGESDQEIVAGAWDFEKINRLYSEHGRVLAARPTRALHDQAEAEACRQWAGRERSAWLAAVTEDPLLPAALLPSSYLGRKAWQQRLTSLRSTAALMRAFDSQRLPGGRKK
jgi:DNA-binding transcriptional regulator PaaX